MKQIIKHLFGLAAALVSILTCAATEAKAQTAGEEQPIITFKTSIYETYGETNAFHIEIGAKTDTYIDVDCGYGLTECEVSQATMDTEAGGITATSISCKVSPEGIVRIYGDASLIDYFAADGCYIRNLDISALTNLEILSLGHNELEELDLTPNTKLQALTLNDNPFNVKPLKVGADKPDLTIIDFSIIGNIDPEFNISDYPSLVSFQAWDTMSLTQVDPTGCPYLQRLSIDVTSVKSLDVTQNPQLKILNISDTQVTDIDISKNPLLTEFYCTNQSGSVNTATKISSLNLTNNPELYRLACSGNNLTQIDLSRNTKLFELFINDNKLTSIDLSNNPELYNVSLRNNYMDFATLPVNPGTWGDYDYAQHNLQVAPAYPVGGVIDLSSRVLREGTQTYAELYAYVEASPNDSYRLDESYYTFADGKITLLKAYPADSVYVAFSNTAFPDVMLYTGKFKVKTAEEYGKPSTIVKMTTGLYDGNEVTMGVGIHGATPENPKEFFVDFGDGNLQAFTATASAIPATYNVSGTKKGYGNVSILVPDGTIISALSSRMPLTDIDLSAARALQQLSLPDAGLYSIDLSWNRLLVTLDLSGNNLSQLSLAGVNSLYTKNLLEDINVSHNNLSEIEISDNRPFRNIDISHNRFEELSLKDASNLETINLSHNSIAEINLAYCSLLTSADMSYNKLTSIVFPEEGNTLKSLDISNNSFTFANMPELGGITLDEYRYAPQAVITIPTKGPGYNLSAQAVTVDGHTTQFVWKNESGAVMTPGTDYEIVNGKTTFKNTEMGRVYCEMTNGAYPDLSGDNVLKTSYILSAGMPTHQLASFKTPAGGQTASLSFRAANGSPALYIDWTGNNDLEQYPLNSFTYTRFAATTVQDADVKVYTYDADDVISVFSISGVTMSSMDASPMTDLTAFTVDGAGLKEITMPESPKLRELALAGNALTSIDLSKYPELFSLALSNNSLSDIDISKNPKLQLLSIAGNKFESLNLVNNSIWHLDASSNGLKSISLDGLPALEQLALSHNELTNINVENLSNLKVMFLDYNKFTFANLPRIKPQYSPYIYINQADVEAEEVDGKIDLAIHRAAYGTDTKYTWYLDKPTFNDYGELEGEELYADDEYVIEEGVTTFLKPFNNVMCVMTNEEFPNLYLYTPMMNVGNSTGINGATAGQSGISISMDNRSITIKSSKDTTAALYTIDGKAAYSTYVNNGEGTIHNVCPGTYVLKVDNAVYKLMVK
ncbi:MAG: hypothetical protein NC344_09840 [Bacteroidales bacterium]|nr:hypothetical protein [Bacteroidales bacterium]MCM1148105.1 hypothetical protein [Bacteroidales bacterium]MCM1206521.1 hypothetical protein [Bacillota bacterium]MCM1510577.1 hypothetical protein [Clostridium sp.]